VRDQRRSEGRRKRRRTGFDLDPCFLTSTESVERLRVLDDETFSSASGGSGQSEEVREKKETETNLSSKIFWR
jgi:hypothetical protein